MKNMKRIFAILIALIMLFSLTACSGDIVADLENIGSIVDDVIDIVDDTAGGGANAVDSITDPKISITMLDVGQGLSVLIESDGKYMLYDGGDRGTSSYVVSYLQKHNVDNLEYIVASHYDSDHLAGLVGVLETIDTENVINPATKATTKIYESYINARDNSGAEVIYPNVGDRYTLGNATFTILAPAKDYGDANEMSVAIKIVCENFACVITGDAEGESEADMLNSNISLSADLYIVGHHGSSSSSSDAFVKAINPDYAFISCGKDNDYGHPHRETLDTLSKYNTTIYRSDKDGEVTCASDGTNIAFSKKASTINDNNSSDDETTIQTEDDGYVLNTNSMKFHKKNCSSVESMSEKNKAFSDKNRDELIADGYSPCGYCDP